MKVFKIPVEWSVYNTVEIEAESMEEAIEIFDKTIDDIVLPTELEYIVVVLKDLMQPIEQIVEYYSLFQ